MKFIKRLSFRLKLITLVWLIVALTSIGFTLTLSWQLEGNVVAIKEVGSLRYRTYQILQLINEKKDNAHIAIDEFEKTINSLNINHQTRLLFLPEDEKLKQLFINLENNWNIKKILFFNSLDNNFLIKVDELSDLFKNIEDLVFEIELINMEYINLLRISQTILLILMLLSSLLMNVLFYEWIIKPLQKLQKGVVEISNGNFGTQVQVNSPQEFCEVGAGFNQMSCHLQQLYTNLEEKVDEKTRDLSDKNHKLEILYFFSRFLNRGQTINEVAEVFLEKICRLVGAKAGSVRLLDQTHSRTSLTARHGLPEALQEVEKFNKYVFENIAHDKQRAQFEIPCEYHIFGFKQMHLFKISYKNQDIGFLTLYLANSDDLNDDLLEALCSQFGVAMKNINLNEENRQLAVLQERNLIAQGLHDSIAQALTFLNLQVQMLTSALEANQPDLVRENLRFIQDGVRECYEDVRELLLNFRTKITDKNFPETITEVTKRFEKQTQIQTRISWFDEDPHLTTEQQLQFTFILQESLSNVRKHAHATVLKIEFENGHDFVMRIKDNGHGFNRETLPKSGHVGFNIMNERAARIRAKLTITSDSDGTCVTLVLPHKERAIL